MIPTVVATEPASILSAPPCTVIIAPIEACMIKKASAPANAATAFSALAIPMATPMANKIGRLENTILPASFITVSIELANVPGPKTPIRL